MREALVYVIEFSDGGPDESGFLCQGTREECERTRDLVPAISYSGSRPVKRSYTRLIPLGDELEHVATDCQINQRGYVEWHLWAEREDKAGRKQAWCATCERYKFPSERCVSFALGDPRPHMATEGRSSESW